MKETFGQRLSQLLAQHSLSQSEFARKMSASPTFVSDMTRDIKKPGADFLERLGSSFDVNLNWLILGEGDVVKPSQLNAEFLRFIAIRVELARMVAEGHKEAELLSNDLLSNTERTAMNQERQTLLNHLARIIEINQIVSNVYNDFICCSDLPELSQNVFQAAVSHFSEAKSDALLSMVASRPSGVF